LGGNGTAPEPQSCEDCIETTLGEQLQTFVDFLGNIETPVSLGQYCTIIQSMDDVRTIQEIEAFIPGNNFGPNGANLENPAVLLQELVDRLVGI
jgi:hypothetical protein